MVVEELEHQVVDGGMRVCGEEDAAAERDEEAHRMSHEARLAGAGHAEHEGKVLGGKDAPDGMELLGVQRGMRCVLFTKAGRHCGSTESWWREVDDQLE